MSSTARQSPAGARSWLRGIRFSWFTFVMLGLLILAVVIIAPTARLYSAQQQQISQLTAQNDAKRAQVDALQAEVKRWDDPAYIKAQARDRLLYVMPGETSYLIIDDRSATPAAAKPKVTTEVQQQDGDWAQTLARSILAPAVEKPAAPAKPKASPSSTPAPSAPGQ